MVYPLLDLSRPMPVVTLGESQTYKSEIDQSNAADELSKLSGLHTVPLLPTRLASHGS